jgi:hypothetical protein
LWWSFFSVGKKSPKGNTGFFFGAKNPLFKKQVAKFHPSFLGEIVTPSLHTGYTF